MVDEILIHFQPVFIGIQVYPIRLPAGKGLPLLQKQDVAGHFRTGSGLERVVGQTDGPQQIGPLCDILSDVGVLLVHRALAGDKGDDAARSDLIQRPGKEIVVNEKVVLVVPLVRHFERPKWHVADGGVKKAVREVCFLKPLDSDRGFLIELAGDTPADSVQLYAVDFGVRQIFRAHTNEVANTAGRFQQIAGLEAHVL